MFKKVICGVGIGAAIAGLTSCVGPHPLAAQTKIIAVPVSEVAASVPAAPVTVAVGQAGVTSLQYNGVDLLADGALSVQTVKFLNADGTTADNSAGPTATVYDAAAHRLTQTYPWGTIACKYIVVGSRLNLTVTVANTSTQTLQALTLQLLALRFPTMPKDWQPNYVYIGSNTGDPTVMTADYGSGELAVCNDDVAGKPLLVGFPGRADFASRPIVVSTAPGWVLSPYLDKYVARPILPGASDTYHVSMRFGASGTTPKALAGDLDAKFALAYPQTLHWTDHRAVGSLHLAASETNLHSATNPRGWFADTSVDVTTPAGIEAFHKRILAYADASVAVLKKMNAQGMVTWDLEGEQYPQSTTYIGDPRLLKTLDPEMDSIADAYFQKFRAAGLRTGLCIRPQRLVVTATDASQQEVDGNGAVAQLLYDKMTYANKRWGCTLFYVDSNGDPNVPYDPVIFQTLTQKLTGSGISALIMPEHKNTRYYAYTAPYAELRLGVISTPSTVRDVYPAAFMNIYAPDGPIAQDHAPLVTSVKHGDVLMFRAWWDDPQNALVQSVYQDAGVYHITKQVKSAKK